MTLNFYFVILAVYLILKENYSLIKLIFQKLKK